MAPTAKAGSTESLFLLLAQDAGLDAIARDFPDDLQIAIQSASQLRNALYTLDDMTAEPWPPMQVRRLA